MKLSGILVALALLGPLAAPAVAAEEGQSVADVLRARLAAEVAAAGLDPDVVLNTAETFDVPQPDGRVLQVTYTPNTMLDALVGDLTLRDEGVAGTPETTVGDILHTYVNVAGSGSALGYRVQDSAVAPATPPVAPPPPASGIFFDVGGPVRSVSGAYLIGVHSAGSAVGSNVDTNGGGSLPVWAPVATSGAVLDERMEFRGHAVIEQAQFCFFGICIAVGTMLATGAAVWDTEEFASLPAVP